MWKLGWSLFFGLTFASGLLCAQFADNKVETSESVASDKAHSFTVTNTSNSPITGMTVTSHRRPKGFSKDTITWYIYDCFLNPREPPLEPSQSYTFDVGNDVNDDRPMELSLDAVIFANGTATGDTAAIKSLWSRREWLVVGFREIFHDIDTASVDEAEDRDKLLHRLTSIYKTRIGPDTPREQRDSIMVAYETVIENIRFARPDSLDKTVQVLRQRRMLELL